MTEKQGWIKLHRTMTDWEWYTDIPVKTLYIHLLLSANHSEQKWRGITIERGELVTSYEHLAAETGLTVGQVRKAIAKLKKTGEISVSSTNKNTRVKCLNYCVYQSRDYEAEQTKSNQSANKEQSKYNQSATNKNEKNYKNNKNERLNRRMSFDIEKIAQRAKLNDDYDI